MPIQLVMLGEYYLCKAASPNGNNQNGEHQTGEGGHYVDEAGDDEIGSASHVPGQATQWYSD